MPRAAVHPLDNPFHASLAGPHRAFALGEGAVLRYPEDVAPFLGAATPDAVSDAALSRLVAPGDAVFLLGEAVQAPRGWVLSPLGALHQMVAPPHVPETDGPPFIELGEAHRADVLALTALVYPHYFRPHTMKLGRYFGIYVAGQLAAMIGERLAPPGFREISAVCTHPDHLGHGHAARLLAWLGNDIQRRGLGAFLHVSPANTRALALYERLGYRTRTMIPFWQLARAPAGARRENPCQGPRTRQSVLSGR